jgi:hypothetical protein
MSLVVTVYVPRGIVMAADSRTTGLHSEEREVDKEKVRVQQRLVLSDNSYKVVALRSIDVGISAYGAALLEGQPVDSHIHRFEEEEITPDDDVVSCAEKLLAYFLSRHPGIHVGLHVGGYRIDGRTSTPFVFAGDTSSGKGLRRVNTGEKDRLAHGVVRGGDTEIANRLIEKKSLPPFAAMPLQDAVDYAVHLIRTTIETMRFEPRFPSVGGPIDVLTVTPDGLRWVQRKDLRGEG